MINLRTQSEIESLRKSALMVGSTLAEIAKNISS